MSTTASATESDLGRAPASTAPRRTLSQRLGLVRLSGLYALVALVVVYSVTFPTTFFTAITLRTTLGDQSITGILALGALVPLAAGLVDLSFGAVAGFSLIFVSWMSITFQLNDALLVAITLVACAGFGLLSSLLVARLGVGSLVVTLGVASVATGLAGWISGGGNTLIPQFGPALTSVGGGDILGVPATFVVLVILSAIALYWLEYTPSGRYMLASGDNPVAARLAGVRVGRNQAAALVTCSVVSGLAGILIAAKVGSASTTTSAGYLLPVVAGLFLGATQVKPRVNVLGTLVAIYLIGVGVKGLQLAGAASWVSDVFNGAVLLLAIALTARSSRLSR